MPRGKGCLVVVVLGFSRAWAQGTDLLIQVERWHCGWPGSHVVAEQKRRLMLGVWEPHFYATAGEQAF